MADLAHMSNSNGKRLCGNHGEDLAATFLERRGLVLLERQAHVGRIGEIDLIALDGNEVVFIEVKTRRGTRFGLPEEAVTRSKLRVLAACAEIWRLRKGWAARPYRLDVVAIDLAGPEPVIRHLENVGG